MYGYIYVKNVTVCLCLRFRDDTWLIANTTFPCEIKGSCIFIMLSGGFPCGCLCRSSSLAVHRFLGDVRLPHRFHLDPVWRICGSQERHVSRTGSVLSECFDIFQHADLQVWTNRGFVDLELSA